MTMPEVQGLKYHVYGDHNRNRMIYGRFNSHPCHPSLISAWWLRTSSNLTGKKSKKQIVKLGNGHWPTLRQVRIRPNNITPPSLSRDRRIKTKQNNLIRKSPSKSRKPKLKL